MDAQKEPRYTSPPKRTRQKLEYLYARRSVIDTLIQSLEGYDRFRTLRAESDKRNTA